MNAGHLPAIAVNRKGDLRFLQSNVNPALGVAMANLKDPKAQGEIDWLKSKMQACGDSCPEAANLKAMTGK